VLAVLLVLQALGTAGFAAVHGFASFLGAAGLAVTAGQVTGGARGALVVGLADGAERVWTLSSLRTVGHVGWAVGAAIGAGVLALDTRGAYLGMVALDAASYLACAAALAGVPRVPPAAVPDGGAAAGRPARRALRLPRRAHGRPGALLGHALDRPAALGHGAHAGPPVDRRGDRRAQLRGDRGAAAARLAQCRHPARRGAGGGARGRGAGAGLRARRGDRRPRRPRRGGGARGRFRAAPTGVRDGAPGVGRRAS
jgi:hypothetical protein